MTWKNLCDKHDYGRRLSENRIDISSFTNPLNRPAPFPLVDYNNQKLDSTRRCLPSPFTSFAAASSRSFDSAISARSFGRPKHRTYKSHFKQRYLVETAWKTGGTHIMRHITPDQGVVTSLHLTSKYIVVALDNAKIHVFDTDGAHQKTLQGHIMGVWAMVPWGDTLVSGGCDRDVRVWDMSTGYVLFTLRSVDGH